jgi:hypothetical protein
MNHSYLLKAFPLEDLLGLQFTKIVSIYLNQNSFIPLKNILYFIQILS